MQSFLQKSLVVSSLAIGAAFAGQNALANPGDVLKWQSVNGIALANNVVGSGSGASTGGGTPWSTFGGHVRVDPDRGSIDFDVEGLVIAAGNSIGTPGPVLQVKGTVVCDTDGSASGGNSVLIDTPLVDLDDHGNAHFDGSVSPLPAVCTSETDVAFLIRTASGRWIANGAVLR
jgi:hypothetical protein